MDYEIVDFNGQPARLYRDGTIRNDRGHALTLPPALVKHAITTDSARDMLRLRAAKRARLATAGALRGVQDVALIAEYGDDAPLVERAQTLQTIASTPDAGKAAVMAAQYLDKSQGYVEDPATPAQTVDAVAELVRELAAFAAGVAAIPPRVAAGSEGGGGGDMGGVVDG